MTDAVVVADPGYQTLGICCAVWANPEPTRKEG